MLVGACGMEARSEAADEPDRWGPYVSGTREKERREKGRSAEVCVWAEWELKERIMVISLK